MSKSKVTAARAGGAPNYREDPDAVSLHTTPADYEYNDTPQLPSYNESIGVVEDRRDENAPTDRFATISQPAPIDQPWNRKKAPTPIQGVGSETSIRMDRNLMDADQLHDYITNYLRVVPPRPSIRIQGWHWQTTRKNNKQEQERVSDFDIVFGLQHLLASGCHDDWWQPRIAENTAKAYRGSWRKTRAPGFTQDIEIGDDNAPPELMDVCRDFASSKASLKAFRVSRTVTGLDTSSLERQITQLIRQTHYLGHIDITFPLSDKNVDIYSPHWVNQLRITWVRWIFYLTFLWIFTWPVLFFLTRWWTVYEVEWRVSVPDSREGSGGRRFAVMSEAEWLYQHTNMIPVLALSKYQGDATDVPTTVMAPDRSGRNVVRLPPTGNGSVDAAINLIQGGVSAWNVLQGRDPNSNTWGADEQC